MSRAYRIKVSEQVTRVIKGSDHVKTVLEILNVLSEEEMCHLLEQELESRGFEKRDEVWVREENGIEIVVDPKDASVTVQVSGEEEVSVEGEQAGLSYDRDGAGARQTRQSLSEQLKKKLEKQVDEKEEKLQGELTSKLEEALGELKEELDQIANAVTGTALKRKASQMGQIKEISEDPNSGSMTIVLEV
ncbi:MAG: hypothetical protein ACFCD0_19820 [Gemmataceae bacterium]